MAEAKFIPQGFAPNIGASLQRGFGIAQQQQANRLAQQQFTAQQEQLELDRQRQATLDAERREEQELDRLQNNFKLAVSMNDFDAADTIIKQYNQAAGTNFAGDFSAMANALTAHEKALKAGDQEGAQFIQNRFLERFNRPVEAAAELLGREDITKRIGREEKIAEEQRAFKEKERQAAITSERVGEERIALKREELELGEEFVEKEETRQEKQIRAALEGVEGLTPDQKEAMVKLGTPAQALKQIIPPDKENVSNIKTFINTTSSLLSAVDEEFNPLITGKERIDLEKQRRVAVQKLASELGIEVPKPKEVAPKTETIAPTPITKGKRPTLKEFVKKARKLNPGVSIDKLQEFYENKYGVEFKEANDVFKSSGMIKIKKDK
jgi:hypothetical protein